MAQSSPQPQCVDSANYALVNPLPSPATSFFSSSDFHLYINSDKSSPSVPTGPPSSSQEPLLQGTSQVSQTPPLFSTAHTAISTLQHPSHQPTIHSWADEVGQSGTSTPETVFPNWTYPGGIRGARPRSQPLVYPPPVLPTPHLQRPAVSSPRYEPTIPPLRPQSYTTLGLTVPQTRDTLISKTQKNCCTFFLFSIKYSFFFL